MDERGNIHRLAEVFDREALERRAGKLVPIPDAELEAVRAMPTAERIAWYSRHLTPEAKRARKNERKRQRQARKKNRR